MSWCSRILRARLLPMAVLSVLSAAGGPAVSARAAVHVVVQSGLTFVPDDLTVQVGDVVQWNWASGSHTVTSGSSLADPQLGALFDAPLNSSNPTFSYTFTSAGDVPYLCRPHADFGMTGIVRVDPPSPAGQAPEAARLEQNHPNPFNPATVISFHLAVGGPVDLRVYDAKGRLVRTLLEGGPGRQGPNQTLWDGADDRGLPAPAGVYLYRLQAEGVTLTRRMSLVR